MVQAHEKCNNWEMTKKKKKEKKALKKNYESLFRVLCPPSTARAIPNMHAWDPGPRLQVT